MFKNNQSIKKNNYGKSYIIYWMIKENKSVKTDGTKMLSQLLNKKCSETSTRKRLLKYEYY